MKTSYLLYLALCSMLFVAVVFGSCGDGSLDDEDEECDLGGSNGPNTGCSDGCLIENNWDCVVTGDECYKLYTVDSDKLRQLLSSDFFFTSNNKTIKDVMDIDAMTADGISAPTIQVFSNSTVPLFDEIPKINMTDGSLIFKVKTNNIQKAQTFQLKITFDVGTVFKKKVVEDNSGELSVEWFMYATFCPTEVQQPSGEPNKKFTCYKSQADADIFYLKRVPLRDINEYQPGDVVSNGVLDCNCNYKQLVQAPVTPQN